MSFTELKKQNLGIKKGKGLSTFLIALLTAAAFFVPFMVLNEGYFLFYGDFNVQQIPFYKHCHEILRSGNIGWDFGTDLGVNFVGSYTFYTLGSPFFWLTLPFPTDFVPYLIGPLLILKFALSALTGYLYISRFTRTPEAARIGGLLYAFSGFAVYNIFFNHFHEAIVFFPLLLLSVELLITENRRGFFAAMVAVTAITNYFFFFGMVVFTVIYWFVRVFSGCYKIKFSGFLWFLFEAVLGVLMAAVILLPTCYAVLGNSRITEFLHGWNAITYGKEQIYLNIFECFFFPPDIPAR
ncbi:MAG: YfhO family protein, partial [Clostridia bacterium]|nr:YfhO family protein [Clostridia bacterium]